MREKLTTSWKRFWHSPALLSVMLMELIIIVVLSILFVILDSFVLAYLNKEVLIAANAVDWRLFLNAKTIVIGGILLLMQAFIMVYVDSFFKAGFYGMLKNTVHDASTNFYEFMPSAKRYWYAMFRFLLLRYALLILILLPFFILSLYYSSINLGPFTNQQQTSVTVGFGIGVIGIILLTFFLLFAEAVIVFEDEMVLAAVKRSAHLATKRFGNTLVTLIVFAGILLAGILLSTVIAYPFQYAAVQTQSSAWITIANLVEFVLNIVTISASIIANLYVFFVYKEIRKK